ncbi:hypothetical protein R4Z10_13100 [Niallia sp. XMNu-256]|uniref:hypothetical protein n=1 Tax=Niallia sp. XMNu-256 TaxID=3082444 RepID=UPI0030D582F5
MFENIEVGKILEDQFHERHRFKVNVRGDEYAGIYHKGEVQWFNPHPRNTLEGEHLNSVESSIQYYMIDIEE